MGLPLPGPLRELLHPAPTPGLLAVFGHLDAAVEAIGKLKAQGRHDFTVFSPVPRHELQDALAQPVSPVRMWTLVGGIVGCGTGFWLSLWTSYQWPLVVGGKTIGSIPPYVVIGFEMTVLFGALTTLLGVLFNAALATRRMGHIAYDPRFTND
ncbi:MAG: DUF3341 domain-containing protein, partial [Gemmatimonadales bacterium]